MKMIRTILFAAFALLPLLGNAQTCAASFTYTTNGLAVTFDGSLALAGGPNTSYYWWFDDNSSSANVEYPTHTFSAPGTYTVCFSVMDQQNQCYDSICQTITVGSSGGCSVDFTWIDSLGYAFFISSSTLGNGGYYVWDLGDGNFVSGMNPSYVYSAAGLYTVCVTVYDSMQQFCDSTCHQVLVQSQQSAIAENNLLQNSLLVSPNPADAALNLSFYAEQSGNASITFYDAAGRIATTHSIILPGKGQVNETVNTTSLAQGIYLVKLEVNGSLAWTRIALAHQ